MSRLIDADKLKESIDNCDICNICPDKDVRCSYDCGFPDFVTEKWNVAIDAQPTIDAVEVVRCKERKHGKYEFVDNKDWFYCKHHYDYWAADDFCSYGERER